MQRINFMKLLLCIFFIIFLTGCQDRNEVENKSFVIAIGLDESKKDHMLRVTYLISNPEYGTLQESGYENSSPHEIVSLDAPDFITTKDTLNTMIPKQLTYELLEQIVISEKLARNERLLSWLYEAAKDTEIRRDITLFISKETPEVFFENVNPELEIQPHKYFAMIKKQGEKTGSIPAKSDLLLYYRILEAKGDLFLASYATTDVSHSDDYTQSDQFEAGELDVTGETSQAQFAGSAVFKDGVMIGKLNSEETRLSIILNNTLESDDYFMVIQDPFQKNLTITIKLSKNHGNDVKMDLFKETPTIDIKIPLQLSILSNPSMTDFSKPKNREKLKKHLKKEIEKKFDNLIEKTQKEFKAQPFGWSLIARKSFLTLKEYNNYNFKDKYAEMDINLDVDLKIVEYGRQKTIPNKKEIKKND